MKFTKVEGEMNGNCLIIFDYKSIVFVFGVRPSSNFLIIALSKCDRRTEKQETSNIEYSMRDRERG